MSDFYVIYNWLIDRKSLWLIVFDSVFYLMWGLDTPERVPEKHVLKCLISRVVDWMKQYLFLVISDEWRYSGYLDLPWGKIDEWSIYDKIYNKNYPIKLLKELLPLFQGIQDRNYLLTRSESFAQCVWREVREETSIPMDVAKLNHLSTHRFSIKWWTEILIVISYVYELWEHERVIIKLSSEHTKSYRLTKEQMEQSAGNIVPSLRYVLWLSQEFVDEKPRAFESIT